MKRITFSLILTVLMCSSGVIKAQDGLSKADRGKAVEHLKMSQADLIAAIKGLSEAQLNYKSSEDAWSIAECVEHIAISENALFGVVNQTLETDADPSRRSEVKMTDEQIVGLITNRTEKIKTRPDLEPKNSFGSYTGSVDEFKTKRKQSIKFVKKTDQDLRNHYFEFPFGVVDSYQVIMFMSGHSIRHTDQIKEIMASDSFPKS